MNEIWVWIIDWMIQWRTEVLWNESVPFPKCMIDFNMDWPEVFIMSCWQITSRAMSWTGNMQGSLVRKMTMRKEKTGGWQTSRRRFKNGCEVLRKGIFGIGRKEWMCRYYWLHPDWTESHVRVKCRDTTACILSVYWPSWHNVCLSISKWRRFCQSYFILWKEYRRKVITVIQVCEHC